MIMATITLEIDKGGMFHARIDIDNITLKSGPWATRDGCLHDVGRAINNYRSPLPSDELQPQKEAV